MHWRRIIAIVLGFWVWFYMPNVDQDLRANPKPVAVRVTPRVGLVPTSIRAVVTIDPHPGNRELCLAWGVEGSGLAFNTSCRSLEGADTPRTFQYVRELREPGTWFIAGVVRRVVDGNYHLLHATEYVEVKGRE